MAGKPGMHKKPMHPARIEEMREKIKATLIIKKLENHILDDKEMTASQVTAALGLLRKSVPDLSAIELESNTGKPGRLLGQWIKS